MRGVVQQGCVGTYDNAVQSKKNTLSDGLYAVVMGLSFAIEKLGMH